MSPSTYCTYVLCMQPASSSTVRCDISPLSLPVVWLWECSTVCVYVCRTGAAYHGSGAIQDGSAERKARTHSSKRSRSGCPLLASSCCPAASRVKPSAASLEISSASYIIARGCWIEVVFGTSCCMGRRVSWLASTRQPGRHILHSTVLGWQAGWYTCVLLFAGVDLLSTPQKLCVVEAGRHGSHRRG